MLSQGQLIEIAIKTVSRPEIMCNIRIVNDDEIRFDYQKVTYQMNSQTVGAFDASGTTISGDAVIEARRRTLAEAIGNEI